jgi:superfamily II DNA or RNA helicase
VTSLALPFFAPAPAPVSLVGRSLRPYQVEAFTGNAKWPGIRACLARHRSTSVILFTGGGKSSIAAQAALEAGGRVLFLAHLDTLVGQARAELADITGVPWELEQAGWTAEAHGHRNVVASVSSLMQPRRLERFARDAFALIIVDEAHHYVSKAYKRPLDYFASAKILALTATPRRKDRKALGRYVESVAYKMDLVEGIDAGWSVEVTCGAAVEMAVDLDAVKVNRVSGDYDQGELDAQVAEAIAPAVKAAKDQCGDWPTIIWTPGVQAAHAAARALNEWKPGCARAVDGSMPKDQKRSIIAAHKRREFQFIANCGVLVEGYSDRGLVCMIDAAKTKSDLRVVQRLGRILRPLADVDACPDNVAARKAAIAASTKPRALWIDLKCNCRPGSLNAPQDAISILGGTYTDAEKKAARKALESKGGDPRAALEEARRRIAEKAARARVRMTMRNFDPTKGMRAAAPAGPAPVTPKQLRACERFGIDAAGMTAAEVQKLLRYEFMAQAKGWCDHRQRQWLQRNLGVSGKGLPRSKGKALAEAWKRNGKLRLGPAHLASIMHPEPGSAG